MLNALRGRLNKNEEGFTLIELMVVVLIIAILIAIAIPTFLGAQDRARDRGAQSDLRNALTAAKTLATDYAGAFQYLDTTLVPPAPADIDAAGMLAAEPSLVFDDAAPSTSEILVVTGAGGTDVTFVKESASGTFFCISATSDGVVTYGRDDSAFTAVDTAAECTDASW